MSGMESQQDLLKEILMEASKKSEADNITVQQFIDEVADLLMPVVNVNR